MHEQITADPDVEQAIRDLKPVVAELHQLEHELHTANLNERRREVVQEMIDDRMGRIRVRAERIGLSIDDLVALVAEKVNQRAWRGRGAPAQPTSRVLQTAVTNAKAKVVACDQKLAEAQKARAEAGTELSGAIAALEGHAKAKVFTL